MKPNAEFSDPLPIDPKLSTPNALLSTLVAATFPELLPTKMLLPLSDKFSSDVVPELTNLTVPPQTLLALLAYIVTVLPETEPLSPLIVDMPVAGIVITPSWLVVASITTTLGVPPSVTPLIPWINALFKFLAEDPVACPILKVFPSVTTPWLFK